MHTVRECEFGSDREQPARRATAEGSLCQVPPAMPSLVMVAQNPAALTDDLYQAMRCAVSGSGSTLFRPRVWTGPSKVLLSSSAE